jgi:PAS domain S-box-containing protein
MIGSESILSPATYQMTSYLAAPSSQGYAQHPTFVPQQQQAMQAPVQVARPGLLPVPGFPPVSYQQHLPMPPVSNMAVMAASAPGNKRRRVDAPMAAMTARCPPPPAAGLLMMQMQGRGRQKSQAQVDRRRERNRILARRTRLRKKFFFESLQKEVTDLQLENAALKEIAKTELPEEMSTKLLSECKAMDNLPEGIVEACNEGLDLDSQDFILIRSIQRSQQCFVITDPSLQDNPIVYASEDFLSLTGYKREEVLGRNCRFLQGTETSTQKLEEVRKAVSMGEDVSVTMINYTADGTAFWNKLFIAALRDAHNNIVNFIGVIVKVSHPDPEDPEAGKKLPGEQSNDSGDEDMLDDYDDADGTIKAMKGAVSAATPPHATG